MTSPRIEWQNEEIVAVLADGAVMTTVVISDRIKLSVRTTRRALKRLRTQNIVASRKTAKKEPITTGKFKDIKGSYRWVTYYEWRLTTEQERLVAEIDDRLVETVANADAVIQFLEEASEAYQADMKPAIVLARNARRAITEYFGEEEKEKNG